MKWHKNVAKWPGDANRITRWFFFQFSHKSLKVFWCGVQLEVFKKIDSVFHLFCLKSLQSSEVSHVFSFSLPLEPFFIFISLIQQYQQTWWTLKTFEAGHHFYLALYPLMVFGWVTFTWFTNLLWYLEGKVLHIFSASNLSDATVSEIHSSSLYQISTEPRTALLVF